MQLTSQSTWNIWHAGLAKGVDQRKKLMALLSASLLAMVPWMQISRAVHGNVSMAAPALLAATATGVCIHLLFLAFNLTAVKVLRLGGADDQEGEANISTPACGVAVKQSVT